MADCGNTAVGYPPFVDGVTTYLGEEVSLYPASNTIPAGHAAQQVTAAAAVERLDSSGNPASTGKVGLLMLGMSNAKEEIAEFIRGQSSDRSSGLVIVNGAQTAHDAAYMYSNMSTYLTLADAAVVAKGITVNQVQVIWLKTAVASETGSFPTHAQTFQSYLKYIVQELTAHYPNLQQIFLSSRTYGGYASIATSPEPWAYEGAFAIKWLIESQIDGSDMDLAYGTVPVLDWGPYLWSDGEDGRTFDSLVWNCVDYESDGTHPAGEDDGVSPPDGAEYKVAVILHDFFSTNPYTEGWYFSIEPTLHGSVESSTDATSYQIASYTPTDGMLQVVVVISRLGSTPNQPTLTGHGLTYALATDGVISATRLFSTEATQTCRISIYIAPSSSPTTGALTIDFSGQTQLSCVAAAFEIDGIYNHADAPVQVKVNSSDSVSSLSITMDAETIEAAMFAAFGNVINSRMTERSGWSELYDAGASTPALGTEVQFLEGYEGTASASKSGAGTMHMGGIAVGFRAPPPSYLLEVTVVDDGAVTSSPSGISCETDCDAEFYEGTEVTLTAVPGAGVDFIGWSGDYDSVNGLEATVTMDAAKSITATFRSPLPVNDYAPTDSTFPAQTQTEFGLSVFVFSPIIGSYLPEGVFRGDFGKEITSWQHEISALGGYLTAEFVIPGNLLNIEDWLESGLGRHVQAYSPDGDVMWEGLVNELTAEIGALSITRGPLLDIGNRVSVSYTPILDDTVSPPLTGASTVTVIAEHAASQAKYGIIEKMTNAGTITDDTAEQIRDTWLQENALPITGSDYAPRGESQPTLRVRCVGYVEFLKNYIYNQSASSLSVTLTTKLEAVLAADPNAVLSTDYALIATNALLTNSYDNEDRDAWTIIKELVSQGDINDNRYLFGIYAGRKAKYAAIPTTIRYSQSVYGAQRFLLDHGVEVPPWRIKVGEFVSFDDFLVGRQFPTTLREDPRILFIESVSYTAPFDFRITGGRVSKLSQYLARLGLGSE